MSSKILIFAVGLITLLTSCAHQPVPSATNAATPSTQGSEEDQKLPFDRPPAPGNVLMPSTALVPVPQSVPAGTTVTVRMQAAVSSASSHSGDTFSAILDQPIIVKGETVLAPGTAVTGRVVTAKRSEYPQSPGFLRLTLSSLTVEGKPVRAESSSIFIKGLPPRFRAEHGMASNSGESVSPQNVASDSSANGGKRLHANGNRDVELPPQHRLTFRLSKPLAL